MYCSNMFYPPVSFVPTYPLLLQACAADGINEDCYLYADGTIRSVAEVEAAIDDEEQWQKYECYFENPHAYNR